VRKDYGVALGAGAGGNDPDQGLYTTYMCNADRNYMGYCNREVDKLIDQQSREPDQESRKSDGFDAVFGRFFACGNPPGHRQLGVSCKVALAYRGR
jgi:hypothetical protein